jgi:hypothetical protein
MDPNTQIKCHSCNKLTPYSKEAIIAEIKRLITYNYEILACQYCHHKFSKEDFEKALGTFKYKDTIAIIDKNMNETTLANSAFYSDPEIIENIKKQEKEKAKLQKTFEEEKAKMQSGQPYDKKIVGPIIDMEQGTPGDRRCIMFLKKEGELYGYAYLIGKYIFKVIDYVFTGIVMAIIAISTFIWNIIKKINWCIICSIIRIGYFIGYIGLLLNGIIATFIFHEAIFKNNYTSWNITFSQSPPYYMWTLGIILLATAPMILQLFWAFTFTQSRWAKIIKKRADEITK